MAGAGGTWDALYRASKPSELPWFSDSIDADVDQAIERHGVAPSLGPVLDLGTGPGTVALELARRDFTVTALDLAEAAIRMARKRAGRNASRIQWIATDLFAASFPGWFQAVFDRGVYHSLPLEERRAYADRVPGWLRAGGFLILKAFSTDEPGDWGPNRIPRPELEGAFRGRLELVELRAAEFPGTLDHAPKAWLAVYRSPGR